MIALRNLSVCQLRLLFYHPPRVWPGFIAAFCLQPRTIERKCIWNGRLQRASWHSTEVAAGENRGGGGSGWRGNWCGRRCYPPAPLDTLLWTALTVNYGSCPKGWTRPSSHRLISKCERACVCLGVCVRVCVCFESAFSLGCLFEQCFHNVDHTQG